MTARTFAAITTVALLLGLTAFAFTLRPDERSTPPAHAIAPAQASNATSTYRTYTFREWYLQSVWKIHRQNPQDRVLAILYGLSDTHVENFVVPNTGEDFHAAKTRILSALGPNPSDLEIHTAIILESYTAGECSNQLDGQCYLLTIMHWAIAAQILDTQYELYGMVIAPDYTPVWANWNIPRPSPHSPESIHTRRRPRRPGRPLQRHQRPQLDQQHKLAHQQAPRTMVRRNHRRQRPRYRT